MSTISQARERERRLATTVIISATLTGIPIGLMIWYLADDLTRKHNNLLLTLIVVFAIVAGLHIINARRRAENRDVTTTLRAIRNTQYDQFGADQDDDGNAVH